MARLAGCRALCNRPGFPDSDRSGLPVSLQDNSHCEAYNDTNGTEWSVPAAPPPATTKDLWEVGYFNGGFYGVGMEGMIATSADGNTWNVTTIEPITTTSFIGATYGNGHPAPISCVSAISRALS